MKKLLKILGLGLLALILLILIVPLFVSKSYTVEESIVINAPKSMVFEYISNFNNFHEWSPWQDRDPEMEVTITGDGKSVGSIYQWEGNKEAGQGSMEITDINQNHVDIDLRFLEPFESESFTQYRFEETEGGTRLIWYMEGEMPYPLNLMNIFSGMEKAIGKDYQKGLEAAKTILENRNSLGIGKYTTEETELTLTTFWGLKNKVSFLEMEDFFNGAYTQIYEVMEANNVEQEGIPSALYFIWDEENMQTTVGVTLAFEGAGPEITGTELSRWEFSGPALKIDYHGNYDGLGDAHGTLHEKLESLNKLPLSPAIEKYLIGPPKEPNPEGWVTQIYYLIDQD